MAVSSDINICNMALANLGVEPIVSFTEATQQARICGNFYTHVRDYLQGSYSWGFNKQQIMLVRDAVSVIPGWVYIYAYPVNALNVQRVYEAVQDESGKFVERVVQFGTEYGQQAPSHRLFDVQLGEKRRICTDIANAWAECRVRVEDASLWPSAFVEVITWGLATRIALALTKSQDIAGNCNSMYQQALGLALVTDASESHGYFELPTSWLDARG